MFKTAESYIADSLAVAKLEQNYIIQPGDIFTINVYGNDGEMLIDPDNLLKKELELLTNRVMQQPVKYFVQENGSALLPVVGEQILAGKTLIDATQFLNDEFSKYYTDAFVNIEILNKRVVVFGPSGGSVLPLASENMSVLEALALSKEITDRAYVDNIRLIRGNLRNPNVLLIDLSTVDGMRNANLALKPNDIIYIEPKQALFSQAFSQNISPILAAINTIVLSYAIVTRNR